MRIVRALGTWSVLVISFVLISSRCMSQAGANATHDQPTISALFLSDIHFEPFWDPAKTPQLAAAPVTQWSAILSSPESSDRAAQFAALQKSCNAKGVDTSFPLLGASLNAMHTNAGDIRFITLSGDLIAHSFSCKLHRALPHATEAEYQSFAAKTVAFVVDELKTTFPDKPVYVSLGNNDSNCGDYKLDPNSEFLSATGKAAASSLPAAERAGVERTFAAGGYFSATLPMRNTRLLILDDLFMSAKYASCSDKPDTKPAADQIAWLREQLNEARRDHEKIWVMSHIPPGVDAYSTAKKMRDVCGGEAATTFLASDALASTLAEYGDVIKLVLFGHTHMDELRLLEPAAGASASHPAIAVKMASSISPVDGNNPSFTVAQIDPANATLVDYQVFSAPDPAGSSWSKEYDFAGTYHEPAFTPTTLTDLIAGFSADGKAQAATSQSFLHNYFVGDRADELKAFWPEYVCTLENRTPEAYRNCVCPSVAKSN
jgi:sphingomyelin phosphodiesterase acid-like 3